MPEQNPNLWAPWRMQYIEQLSGNEPGGCFLCRYAASAADDVANHVLRRSEYSLTLLNRFPYTTGHLLVAPTAHVASFESLPESVLLELTLRVRDAKRVLDHALQPQGYNVGVNLGRCAGAGLPDHVHWHIVPRWNGDTNFMATVGDVRMMPMSLEQVRDRFIESARAIGV